MIIPINLKNGYGSDSVYGDRDDGEDSSDGDTEVMDVMSM